MNQAQAAAETAAASGDGHAPWTPQAPRRRATTAAAAALVVACCAGTLVYTIENVDTRAMTTERAIEAIRSAPNGGDRHVAAAALAARSLEVVRELQRIATGDDLAATEARNALARLRKELDQ